MVDKQDFVEYLYQALPEVYRHEDYLLETQPLLRYMMALVEGGYGEVIKDSNNFLDLVDPVKCPDKFLPMLCESFGLQYYEDIDNIYQRRFLSNIGELTRRRGTDSSIKYLVRILTGLNTELHYEETAEGRILTVTLLARTLRDIDNIGTSVGVVQDYLQRYIPFYIRLYVVSTVATQLLENTIYTAGAVTGYKHYRIG